MPKELFPFRYRDPLTGNWVRARYVAERHVIAERYEEWEITGPPEVRGDGDGGYFRPYPPRAGPASNVEHKPGLDQDERYLVLLFLRRYVTYCVRRRRYAQMQGAARPFKSLRSKRDNRASFKLR